MKKIKLQNITISNNNPFVLIAGPCAMESLQHAVDSAGFLQELTKKLDIPFVFKSSFDKANRTSINSNRGVGIEKGIEIFAKLKKQFNNIPIVTDIHLPQHPNLLKDVVDILQIPAFLCRQTDLLVASAESGLIVNVKKGQFLSPTEMSKVIEKIYKTGNEKAMICERGTSFGYNTLINDFKGLKQMKDQTQAPIIFDATHSCQQPGGNGITSGGQREFAEILSRCALSIGIAGVFMETHENPDSSCVISDGPNMIPFSELEEILLRLKKFDNLAKSL